MMTPEEVGGARDKDDNGSPLLEKMGSYALVVTLKSNELHQKTQQDGAI